MISARYAVVGRAVCAASLLFLHAADATGGLEAECQDIHSCKAALHESRRKGGAEGAALVQTRFTSQPAAEKPSLGTDDTADSAAAESDDSPIQHEAAKQDGSVVAGHFSQQVLTATKNNKEDKHHASAIKHEKHKDINGAHAVGYALVFLSVPAIVCLCISLMNMQSFLQGKKEQAEKPAEHVEKPQLHMVVRREKYSRTPSTPSLNSVPFSDASTVALGTGPFPTSDSFDDSKERTPPSSNFSSDRESDDKITPPLPLVQPPWVPARQP